MTLQQTSQHMAFDGTHQAVTSCYRFRPPLLFLLFMVALMMVSTPPPAAADDVASLVHAHPTQNETLGEAAMALAGKPLHNHG